MNVEILAGMLSRNWCIDEDYFTSMTASLRHWVANGCSAAKNVMHQPRSQETRNAAKGQSIAVIPVCGPIEQRSSLWLEWFGGTSTEVVGQQLDAAIADRSVKGVLLDISSPGGSVYGVQELATKIFAARGVKPIVAIADSMAASAAYWIGSAADKLYVTPSGEVGSIGVFSIHEDWSKALADDGIKITITRVPKFKAEGNPYEPATEEFLDHEQSEIGRIYMEFVKAVAAHRATTVASVRKSFGEGRTVAAKAAVAAGMADDVLTFPEVASRIMTGHIRAHSKAATQEIQQRELNLRLKFRRSPVK